MAVRLPVCRSAATRFGSASTYALAALLLVWQALFASAHLHASAPGWSAATAAATTTARSSTPTRPDLPADCPICRQMAHAGPYLTPGQAAVPVVAAAAPIVSTAAGVAGDAASSSHAWRSRAPPLTA